MIFNQASYYLLFLGPSVAFFHLVRESARAWVIAITGILFFVYYADMHFGGLLGAATVLILLWELLTSRFYGPRSLWSILGVLQAVLILAYFKYSGFFAGVLQDVAGVQTARWNPVLPLGISFFTFEFIHFATESYRGNTKQAALKDYAAFIFFFPTMVAGPIKRFEEFTPKLHAARLDASLLQQGIERILIGLAKKHVLADTFAIVADRVNGPAFYEAGVSQILGWILAYGMKIYFDFSAYSDIAIGSARLFGIQVPENFHWPYLSRDIAEFWRRWHISLGRWIFDYVYAPLGGSRLGRVRTGLNLLLAFAVSGLWHGAAYNFVLWGLWHGLLMVIHRAWSVTGVLLPRGVGVALTFFSVTLGWGFFCMDISRIGHVARLILRSVTG